MSRRAAAAASSSAASALSGIDIGRIMSSKGPIVKCVLLRAAPAGASSERRAGDDGGDADDEKADGVGAEAGGGEGKEVSAMSIKEIKRELESRGVDASTFVEKPELIKALEGARAAAGGDEEAAGGDGGDGEVKVVSQDDEVATPRSKPNEIRKRMREKSEDASMPESKKKGREGKLFSENSPLGPFPIFAWARYLRRLDKSRA